MKVDDLRKKEAFKPFSIKITFETQKEFLDFHHLIGNSQSSDITDAIYEVLDRIKGDN